MSFFDAKKACSPYAAGADSYKDNSELMPRQAVLARYKPTGLLILVVVALLFAQMLGLAHTLAHAPHGHVAGALAPQQAHGAKHESHAGQNAHEGESWLETLFAAHDEGSNTCRVFDLQGQGALLASFVLLALPAVLGAGLPLEGLACPAALDATPFQARAPPFLL